MIGRMILFGSVIVSASAPFEAPAPASPRFRLECHGTMAGADAGLPPISVIVSGMVDLEHRHVRGFGLSIEPIRSVNPERIEFGSVGSGGRSSVDGIIDRATLQTEIAIRAARDGKDPRAVMRLDCKAAPALY